jgi:crossover junction endodeoxyribonuclease RuvC
MTTGTARRQPAGPPGPADGERILGIDPGLQRTGYAVLSAADGAHPPRLFEAGVIRLPRQRSLEHRLVELERHVSELIDQFSPTRMACEALYAHYKHPRTAILMGHARGVVLACAVRHGLEVISVSATNAKKLLTGNGHATKRQTQRAVAALLGLLRPPEPHDVADAISIALCGLRLRDAERAVRSARGADAPLPALKPPAPAAALEALA